jgi:poly(3-hydroxybutyrate) depolymerase
MFKKKIMKQFRFSISSIISKYLLVSLFPLLFIVFLSIAADCSRDYEGKINGNETTEQKNKVLSAENTAKFLAKINGCELFPQIGWEQDKDPSDGTRVKKEIYNQCKDGKKVILYTIEGGGHTWPGGLQYLPERIIGKTSKDLDANQLIWDFFKESSIK